MRTRFAEHIIREKRPRLMLVHLFDLDHFQHDYGPLTKEAFAMLEKTDGYVGRILDASARAGTLPETAVFIVSDHGFRPVRKLIHPGAILARAGLIKVSEGKDAKGNARAFVEEWDAWAYLTNGSCSIMLRRGGRSPAKLREVRAALNDFLRREGPVFSVLEAKEVRRRGADPGAALMLEGAEGYGFGGNLTGEALTDNKQRGAHGYLPMTPDYRASLIASGASVARRGDLGTVRMTDIGPTIARALSLSLRDAEGKPLRLR
ncbi:MAG: alkaline phosphatase family protein [Acidobacteria bacterium]|nr:alkaline phosphatase family protein [Acidobacteriota bacterium]